MESEDDEQTDGETDGIAEPETLTRGTEWAEEAFRDAGVATFGDR